MDSLFDPTCVSVGVTINNLNLTPNRNMPRFFIVLRNRRGLSTRKPYVSVKANRNEQPNRKTELFLHRNRIKTAKLRPKIPVPSSWLKNDTYLSLAFVHGGTTQHSSTQPWKTATTWGFWAKKTLQVGPALHYVTETLFWLVAQNF